jgi:hypothetical protein
MDTTTNTITLTIPADAARLVRYALQRQYGYIFENLGKEDASKNKSLDALDALIDQIDKLAR